jgi:2-polyprenyl-3-methyl-5-hydroxy-6-metoxy-1,4-benzoquinol methylase
MISEVAEFWNTDSDNTKILSHRKGFGKWTDEQKWLEIGQSTNDMLQSFLARDTSELTIAEYGCGCGSESLELCKYFKWVYGIDISIDNLAECVYRSGYNFTPVLIEADKPEQALCTGQVDVFLSVATYQHFPDKAYGERVTNLAYQMLKDKGCALIQIRYDNGYAIYSQKTDNYKQNVLTFSSYKPAEFIKICKEKGFNIAGISTIPGNHCQYYFMEKE